MTTINTQIKSKNICVCVYMHVCVCIKIYAGKEMFSVKPETHRKRIRYSCQAYRQKKPSKIYGRFL